MSIPDLDLLLHPLTERRAYDGRTAVEYPLAGTFGEVLVVREEVPDVWVLPGELSNMLQRKILVLRHENRLDAVGLEMALFHRDNVPEL